VGGILVDKKMTAISPLGFYTLFYTVLLELVTILNQKTKKVIYFGEIPEKYSLISEIDDLPWNLL